MAETPKAASPIVPGANGAVKEFRLRDGLMRGSDTFSLVSTDAKLSPSGSTLRAETIEETAHGLRVQAKGGVFTVPYEQVQWWA